MTISKKEIKFNYLADNFKYLIAYSEEDYLRINKKIKNINNDIYMEKINQDDFILNMYVRKQNISCKVKVQKLKNKDYKIELIRYEGKEDEEKISLFMSDTNIYNLSSSNFKNDNLEKVFFNVSFLKESIQAYEYCESLINNKYEESEDSKLFKEICKMYKELNNHHFELLKNISIKENRYGYFSTIKSKFKNIEIFITKQNIATYQIIMSKENIRFELNFLKSTLKIHSNIMTIRNKSYSTQDLKKIYPELHNEIYKEIIQIKNLMTVFKNYVDDSQNKSNTENIEKIINDPKDFLELNYLINEEESIKQVLKKINNKVEKGEQNVI